MTKKTGESSSTERKKSNFAIFKAKIGNYSQAIEITEGLKQRYEIDSTYTSIIESLIKNGQFKKGLELAKKIETEWRLMDIAAFMEAKKQYKLTDTVVRMIKNENWKQGTWRRLVRQSIILVEKSKDLKMSERIKVLVARLDFNKSSLSDNLLQMFLHTKGYLDLDFHQLKNKTKNSFNELFKKNNITISDISSIMGEFYQIKTFFDDSWTNSMMADFQLVIDKLYLKSRTIKDPNKRGEELMQMVHLFLEIEKRDKAIEVYDDAKKGRNEVGFTFQGDVYIIDSFFKADKFEEALNFADRFKEGRSYAFSELFENVIKYKTTLSKDEKSKLADVIMTRYGI